MATGTAPEHAGRHREPINYADIAQNTGAAVAASRVLSVATACEFCGFALAETTGAATAAVRFRDGSTVAGTVVCRVNLAINESAREWWPEGGVLLVTGRLFLEVISGSVEGVFFWRG